MKYLLMFALVIVCLYFNPNSRAPYDSTKMNALLAICVVINITWFIKSVLTVRS